MLQNFVICKSYSEIGSFFVEYSNRDILISIFIVGTLNLRIYENFYLFIFDIPPWPKLP